LNRLTIKPNTKTECTTNSIKYKPLLIININ
jgi:hypothetical protein